MPGPEGLPSSNGFFGLLALSIALCGVALGGYNQGWAYARKEVRPGQQWGPSITYEINLGWWDVKSSVGSSSLPFQIEVYNDGARALGVAMVIALSLALLLAAYLGYASLGTVFNYSLPARLQLNDRQRDLVTTAVCVSSLAASLALYSALLLGSDHEYRKQAGGQGHLLPRPDWAAGAALAAVACLFGVRHQMRAAAAFPIGYLPI